MFDTTKKFASSSKMEVEVQGSQSLLSQATGEAINSALSLLHASSNRTPRKEPCATRIRKNPGSLARVRPHWLHHARGGLSRTATFTRTSPSPPTPPLNDELRWKKWHFPGKKTARQLRQHYVHLYVRQAQWLPFLRTFRTNSPSLPNYSHPRVSENAAMLCTRPVMPGVWAARHVWRIFWAHLRENGCGRGARSLWLRKCEGGGTAEHAQGSVPDPFHGFYGRLHEYLLGVISPGPSWKPGLNLRLTQMSMPSGGSTKRDVHTTVARRTCPRISLRQVFQSTSPTHDAEKMMVPNSMMIEYPVLERSDRGRGASHRFERGKF